LILKLPNTRSLRCLTAFLAVGVFVQCGRDPEAPKPQPTAKAKTPPAKPRPPKKRRQQPVQSGFRRVVIPSEEFSTAEPPAATDPKEGAQMDAKAAALLAKLNPLPDKEGCLQILAELSAIRSAKNLAVCERLLAHSDPEVRALALTAVHGAEPEGVGALLDKGMRDTSADVRLQALEAAQHFLPQSELLEQSLSKAVGDSDPHVRQLGLYLGLNQPAAARDRILERAASSQHPDLASAAIGVFQSEPSKPNIERIIRGLGHPSPDVREQARDILALNLQQTFTAPAEAMDWWRKNQHHYSEELVEIVP
jgi:hypothetical protein